MWDPFAPNAVAGPPASRRRLREQEPFARGGGRAATVFIYRRVSYLPVALRA